MSSYTFLATNYEMPEIDNTEVKFITAQQAIELGIEPHEFITWEQMDHNAQIVFVENEEGLDELVISKGSSYGDYGFTSYPFIYQVSFDYSDVRAKQLLDYLKENIKVGQIVELWRIWIGHDTDELEIPYTRCRYEDLSLDHLIPLYNWKHQKYKEQNCLVIER